MMYRRRTSKPHNEGPCDASVFVWRVEATSTPGRGDPIGLMPFCFQALGCPSSIQTSSPCSQNNCPQETALRRSLCSELLPGTLLGCRSLAVQVASHQLGPCRGRGQGPGRHQYSSLPPGPSAFSVVAGSRPRLGPSVPSPCSGEMLTGDPALKFAASGDSWLLSASKLIQTWASCLE